MKAKNIQFIGAILLALASFAVGFSYGVRRKISDTTPLQKGQPFQCEACASAGARFFIMNSDTERRAIEISDDLLQHGTNSQYYRESDKWVIVAPNLWVLSKPELQVKYFITPLGPYKLYNVNSKSWCYEE